MTILRNVSWGINYYIRMISEGPCETEECSNASGNCASGIKYCYCFSMCIYFI